MVVKGCGVFVVLSHSPTLIRLRGVWAEEGEASGFTAGSLPVEASMWTAMICLLWTLVLMPHRPTESLPEGGGHV